MRKLFFIIGIMASVAGCSFGASAEVYSLDSCRQMALTSNKEMMVKAEKVRQAHYTRKEAFAAYLPAFDSPAVISTTRRTYRFSTATSTCR